MKYERLDEARAERDRLFREHSKIVTRAAADVKASKAKFAEAEKKVRDIEFAVAAGEIEFDRARRR